MRKELHVRTHPYRGIVIDYLKANPNSLRMHDKGTINVPTILIWALAKSTGLKSNKTRHIKKRAKILINSIIREFTVGKAPKAPPTENV